MLHRLRAPAALLTVATVAGLAAAGPATAATPTDSTALQSAVTVGRLGQEGTSSIRTHLRRLQVIADRDGNNGTRATGTPGHEQSAEYVMSQLDRDYWTVTTQPFTADIFEDVVDPTLSSPGAPAWVANTDFATMDFSGTGTVTGAPAKVVDFSEPTTTASSSTSGCEAADFAGFTAGAVAVIQRGTCPFAQKAQNAQAAGASAAVIFNEGTIGDPERSGILFGTLDTGSGVTIPVIGTSYAVGRYFVDHPGATVSLSTNTRINTLRTFNVIATSKAGRTDREVISGAHLDSVPEGPGINDDGSGTATQLELARQMAATGFVPRNRVRFIWFSGEEQGLLGSTYYADQLTKAQRGNVLAMLDFDMLASPNYGLFIYDGDGSEFPTAGPAGSGVIEKVFQTFFDRRGLYTERDEFDGRSDYDRFTQLGIPAGGITTGAEVHKTPFQAMKWGGVVSDTLAGQYDPCYHLACDSYGIAGHPDNIDDEALDVMSDAVTDAVVTFAQTTSSTNGTVKSSSNATKPYDWKGDKLLR